MGRRCAKRFSGAVRTRWIQAIYAKKEQAAQSVAAKKIALVGGSSVHFSLSAAMMTEATGHPTINLGTHAGLGLQYLLHRAKESINRGDVVILAIEDPLFYSVRPTRLTAGYSLFFDRGFILNTSIQDAIKIVFGVQPLDVARQHVFYLAPWTDPAVHAKEMGSSGDEGRNKAEAVSEEMKKVVRNIPPVRPFGFEPQDASAAIRQFKSWAADRDITVVHARVRSYGGRSMIPRRLRHILSGSKKSIARSAFKGLVRSRTTHSRSRKSSTRTGMRTTSAGHG